MMCAPVVLGFRPDAADQLTLQLDLPAALPCFAGHFPGFPILPGVVQLDWVMQLGAAHLRGVPPAATDFRIKFKRPVGPGSPLSLTLRHDTARGRLEFTYRLGDAIVSQGQVTLAAS